MLLLECHTDLLILHGDLMEISGFIHDNQFDSFKMLQNLLRTESKLIMLLCLELQRDIQGRNERFLIDSP